jgi:hypothetical protein
MASGVPTPGASPEVQPAPAVREVEDEAGGDELLLGADTIVPATPSASTKPAQPRVFGDDEPT